MCKDCLLLQTRDMTPSSFDKVPSPYITKNQCWRCKAKRQHRVPRPEEVPKELCNLTKSILECLTPLEIDLGPVLRSWQSSGYRAHAGMVRFSWYSASVASALDNLLPEERQRGNAAFEWLQENSTHYAEFIQEHNDFLRKHDAP